MFCSRLGRALGGSDRSSAPRTSSSTWSWSACSGGPACTVERVRAGAPPGSAVQQGICVRPRRNATPETAFHDAFLTHNVAVPTGRIHARPGSLPPLRPQAARRLPHLHTTTVQRLSQASLSSTHPRPGRPGPYTYTGRIHSCTDTVTSHQFSRPLRRSLLKTIRFAKHDHSRIG